MQYFVPVMDFTNLINVDVDLQAYRKGKQKFHSHIERFDKNMVGVNGHHDFKGNIVRGEATSAGFAILQNEFLDRRTGSIN